MLSAYIGKIVIDRNGHILEVNIFPRQRKAFSTPHTGVKKHLDDTLDIFVLGLCFKQNEEISCLLFVKHRAFLLVAVFRKNNIPAR